MDLDAAREFVRGNSRAVLTTLRKDGTPQMSPLNVAVDAAGLLVISSRETAFKTKNLRRDPRAWLCVLNDGFYGEFVQVEGLMTMAAFAEEPEHCRPTFAEVRRLRDRLREDSKDRHRLDHLSMGMSNDFEVAVEEGATQVRIGSALFEGLPGGSG